MAEAYQVFDFGNEAAWKKGVTAVQALSLPGKVAPYSAAQIILSTIFNIIKEEKT